jgi:Domain of unknown function (DUF4329)
MRHFILFATALFTTPVFAQQAQEVALAKSVLNALQPASIRQNREYCGYIGVDATGALVATRARRGNTDSCLADEPPQDLNIIASYHTHAGFEPDFDSEVPSLDDMLADRDEGIDGYVATPGGRLWFVDTLKMQARELCARPCLAADPDFSPGVFGKVRSSYTVKQLRRREEMEPS